MLGWDFVNLGGMTEAEKSGSKQTLDAGEEFIPPCGSWGLRGSKKEKQNKMTGAGFRVTSSLSPPKAQSRRTGTTRPQVGREKRIRNFSVTGERATASCLGINMERGAFKTQGRVTARNASRRESFLEKETKSVHDKEKKGLFQGQRGLTSAHTSILLVSAETGSKAGGAGARH